MKRFFLVFAALVATAAQAQTTSTAAGAQATTSAGTATPAVTTPAHLPAVSVSRNPADMANMTGMDAVDVISWKDAKGVRHYTDDPKKAPSGAQTRKVYSAKAATSSAVPAGAAAPATGQDVATCTVKTTPTP